MPCRIYSRQYRACYVGVNTLVVAIYPQRFLRINLSIGNHGVETAVAIGRHFDVGVIFTATFLCLDRTAYALASLKICLETAPL